MNHSHFREMDSANIVKNISILIVEDELKAQKILSEQLDYFGYRPICVDDGMEALDWLSRNRADMIILDLMLPGMHGFEVCQKVREKHSILSLPILMLSAKGDDTDARVTGLQAGANDFMAKPYNVQELVARVNNLLVASTQRRNVELEILNQVSTTITKTLDLEQILKEIAQLICESMDSTSTRVYSVDLKTLTTTILAEYFNPQGLPLMVSSIGKSHHLETDFPNFMRKILTDSNAFASYITDPNLDANKRQLMKRYNIKSTVTIPLIANDQLFGYIELYESLPERRFTKDEIQLVQTIADQVTMVISNAKLYQDLRQSEVTSLDLLDNAYDMIVRVSSDGRLTYLNNSWLENMGYASDEAIGIRHEQFLRSDQIELYQQAIHQLTIGNNVTDYKLVYVSKVGIEIYVEANFTPHIVDEQLISIRGILRDITPRELAEQQRVALVLEQQKMRVLQQFVSDASHDIKTPLSAALLSLALLERTPLSEKQERYTSDLTERLTRLGKLLEDMLFMSQLEQVEDLSVEAIDVNSIILEVVDRFAITIDNHQHQVLLELDTQLPRVNANRQQLLRCFNNLIENACAYMPDLGKIILRTIYRKKHIIIEVQDNGIGINDTHLPLIFDRFYRIDKARNSALGGTGLGLAIVKSIVDQHNGVIEVESVPGEGTTFRMSLPTD